MFVHTQEAFGTFIVHHIKDESTNTGFSIVPAFGAIMLDLSFNGISVLDAYKNPESLKSLDWGKSIMLYPFPNRLKEGSFHWKGKDYQFPINDENTQNAIHGLGVDKPMNLIKVLCDENSGSLSCQYSDLGKHPYYPWQFNFLTTFSIKANSLSVNFSFENKDESSIPAGLGWHPYFELSDSVDEIELRLPRVEKIIIDERMIPTGEREVYNDFINGGKIGSTVLDNCFAIPSQDKERYELQIKGKKGTINYWQETGAGKFNFVQLFTPPMRKSIAIEPMTCNVDAFNNKEGLIELAPGESISASFGLEFEI